MSCGCDPHINRKNIMKTLRNKSRSKNQLTTALDNRIDIKFDGTKNSK